MAVLPPELSPLVLSDWAFCRSMPLVPEGRAEPAAFVGLLCCVLPCVGVRVDVTTMTSGVSPGRVGLGVTMMVCTWVVGAAEGAVMTWVVSPLPCELGGGAGDEAGGFGLGLFAGGFDEGCGAGDEGAGPGLLAGGAGLGSGAGLEAGAGAVALLLDMLTTVRSQKVSGTAGEQEAKVEAAAATALHGTRVPPRARLRWGGRWLRQKRDER